MSDITCPECKQPCTVVAVDNGIGAYEYWGATGFDSHPFPASDCCEAEIDMVLVGDDEDYYDGPDPDDYHDERF